MARIINDLKNRFRNENIAGKYIYVNVGVYLAVAFAGVFAMLFGITPLMNDIVRLLELPADATQLLYCPWSIVTYMFLHAGIMHILLNMIALYWFGRIFLNFYSTRHFAGVYFLGGITGGLFFVLAYSFIPYFEAHAADTHLVGASAAVLAVVVASAVRTPDYTVNLVFFGPMRLITLAVITVLISILLLSSENAGGNIAHIGGAFAGWLFAAMLNKGRDLSSGINAAGDLFCNLWNKGKGLFKRGSKMRFTRTGHTGASTGKHAADYEYNARKKVDEDEMNRILEKVKKSGYASLSEEEKRRLFDASGR